MTPNLYTTTEEQRGRFNKMPALAGIAHNCKLDTLFLIIRLV